jgi:S-adenosylmethionine-dependent methyltransferase
VGNGFEGSVTAWTAQLGNARNVIRQRLVERQLLRHLDGLAPGSHVVDVGCGQGTIAASLAREGFAVTGVDPSAELLARARRTTAGLDVSFEEGALDDLETLALRPADAVCCHGVLMYLAELGPAVEKLVGALRPGGLLSLLTRNQAGIAFRAGMTGKWTEALSAFDATHYDNRLGVRGARADTPEAVMAACEAAGATVEAWYGVRVFTDHWGDVPPPADIADIVELEDQAGRRDPYRSLAALTHVIARRSH